MSELLEAQLRAAMQHTDPPADDWDGVRQGADRLRRRDRFVQRLAVGTFIVVLGGAVALAVGGAAIVSTNPADGGDDVLRETTVSHGHLYVGLGILAVLVFGFVLASLRRPPTSHPSRLALLVLLPTAYPIVGHVVFPIENDLRAGPVVAKLLAVPCVALLLFFVAQRIRERPSRAVAAASTWAGLGVAVVLIARGFIDDVVRLANEPSGIFRLWPSIADQNEEQRDIVSYLEKPPGSDWTTERILQTELIAVVAIAFLSGLILWSLRRAPIFASCTLMVLVWVSLWGYNAVAPIGLVPDFDFFIGDIALGSTLMELTIFFVPTDIVGSFAVGAASLSMGALLWLWGGPMSRKEKYGPLPLAEEFGVGAPEDDGTVVEKRIE